VVCQFGVMFLPDRVKGYSEARRVLRPGGRFVFNAWDRIEENEATHAVSEAVAALYPDDPPRFLNRVPHGYFDQARIRADLDAAGFADVAIEVIAARGRALSASDPAIGFCQGSPLRNEIEARDPAGPARASEAAAAAVAKRFGDGPIDTALQALVVTAKR
jgi:SAM-dependent methyltransferase